MLTVQSVFLYFAAEEHENIPTWPGRHQKVGPMSTYRVQTATWQDVLPLENLGANALRNSPLTHTILTDPVYGHTNHVQSRQNLAHCIYKQALQDQDIPDAAAKVIKAVNLQTAPPQIQACAWLQWFPQSQSLDFSWTEHLGAGFEVPPCVNESSYYNIEQRKYFHRRMWMGEKPHYCRTFPLHRSEDSID